MITQIREEKLKDWYAAQVKRGLMPRCPKCGSFSWKLHQYELKDDFYDMQVEIYISCTECGLKMLYKTLPARKLI
jgi:DNA-directed RNA polymerase subunit RPC12/RpoP